MTSVRVDPEDEIRAARAQQNASGFASSTQRDLRDARTIAETNGGHNVGADGVLNHGSGLPHAKIFAGVSGDAKVLSERFTSPETLNPRGPATAYDMPLTRAMQASPLVTAGNASGVPVVSFGMTGTRHLLWKPHEIAADVHAVGLGHSGITQRGDGCAPSFAPRFAGVPESTPGPGAYNPDMSSLEMSLSALEATVDYFPTGEGAVGSQMGDLMSTLVANQMHRMTGGGSRRGGNNRGAAPASPWEARRNPLQGMNRRVDPPSFANTMTVRSGRSRSPTQRMMQRARSRKRSPETTNNRSGTRALSTSPAPPMRLEEVESYDGAEYDAAGFDAFADMVMRGDNFIEQDGNPGSNGGAAPAAAAGQTGGAGGPGGRRPRVHVSRHGSISIQAGSAAAGAMRQHGLSPPPPPQRSLESPPSSPPMQPRISAIRARASPSTAEKARRGGAILAQRGGRLFAGAASARGTARARASRARARAHARSSPRARAAARRDEYSLESLEFSA